MNQHEARQQRALLLLQQQRYELAAQELRQYLSEYPDLAWPHAMLAICLCHLDRHQEAHHEAEAAVGLEPDNAFNHYGQSVVLMEANCLPEAEQAVRAAIGLQQWSATYFGQLATVLLRQRRWQEGLSAAEQGLQVDPADDTCTNLRSVALIKLGRRTEADQALRGALERDPDDAYTHANLGWTLIEKGQYAEAMTHFREALRLEPNLEHAREGIITALKAQNILYRPILWYFLWVQKLNAKYAMALMIGLFLAFRFVGSMAVQNPQWAPVLLPLLGAYVLFALTSWLANPLFNLVLFTHRFGRLALSRDERRTSMLVAGCLSLAVLFAIGVAWSSLFIMAAIGMLLATLPLSKVFDAESGWPRWGILALGLIVAGMGIFPLAIVAYVDWCGGYYPVVLVEPTKRTMLFCEDNLGIAAIASQLISQVLARRQSRRIRI
jgi:tetratricopeptide (TPR) repeat protein